MRIVYLSAGAGSLRCGACAHDFLLISRLRQLAHIVNVVPVYTPVHTDLGDVSPSTTVALGGISSYLRVNRPKLAKAWRILRPVLDSGLLLDIATRRMISTDPQDLGDMTLSVLQGRNGPHAAEIDRVVGQVRQLHPEVMLISNTLLAPLAGPIAAALQVPVFSGFLGEDSFIMGLPEPQRADCIALLRRHAADLEAVLCPSAAASQQAAILLQCRPDQLRILAAPVDTDLFARPSAAISSDVPVIGTISVIRPAKGTDIILRAMEQVGEQRGKPMHLLIAGQSVDGAFARNVRKLADRLPANVRVHFMGEVSLEEKISMLHRCSVAVFASRISETRAMAAMEAMAAGVPVIAPAHGSFSELLSTGGGWLFEPGSPESLARQIMAALAEPLPGARGHRAAEHVRNCHHPLHVAQQLELILSRQPHQVPANSGVSRIDA